MNFFNTFEVSVIRFKNSEIVNNIEGCIYRILEELNI